MLRGMELWRCLVVSTQTGQLGTDDDRELVTDIHGLACPMSIKKVSLAQLAAGKRAKL